MSKTEKLLDRFWMDPKPSDLSWQELIKIMAYYGYTERQGSGSRVKFVNQDKHKIFLHKRHPDSTLLSYQIGEVRESLKNEGMRP